MFVIIPNKSVTIADVPASITDPSSGTCVTTAWSGVTVVPARHARATSLALLIASTVSASCCATTVEPVSKYDPAAWHVSASPPYVKSCTIESIIRPTSLLHVSSSYTKLL